MPVPEPVHIVLCGDDRVLWGIAASVRSVLENASGPIGVNVLGNGLSVAECQKLRSSWIHPNLAYARIFDFDRCLVQKFRSTAYLKSKSAYARYYIADFLEGIDRCIYLDADLLVFRDLYELENLDLEGKIVAAVRDVSVRVSPNDDHMRTICQGVRERTHIADPFRYFNSGFMYIDLSLWRSNSIKEKLIDVSLKMFDDFHVQDQDALNVILENDTLLIDSKWNTSQYEDIHTYKEIVLHLIGTVKPWHHDYKHAYSDVFFDILDRTSFQYARPPKPGSLAAFSERLFRRVPTGDMVVGKFRRLSHRIGRILRPLGVAKHPDGRDVEAPNLGRSNVMQDARSIEPSLSRSRRAH